MARRVLLLNYEYPPLGGGAGVAAAALANTLAQQGVWVDVVTAADRAAAAPGSDVIVQRGRDGLEVHRVRIVRKGVHQTGMRGAGGYLRAALPVVRRLVRRRRYDVVHCFFSLPTGALLPAAGLRDLPVVVSLRGSDVPGYDCANRSLVAMHALLRPLTRWIWRRADRVVVVSDGLGRLARETDRTLDYAVIPNGVDMQLFHPPGAPARADPNSVIRLLAVARLIARKGIADVLHALARLERGRFHLEIVGSGPDAARLTALTAELGLTNAVRFTGAVRNRGELAERYRAADLFTLAPHHEAFGNVFAEALASGLPVVGSTVGGIPELVRDQSNGLLVPPGEPEALAAAIQRLAADPARRRAMAIRNRTHAEQALSWESASERYMAIYGEVIGRRRSRHAGGDTMPYGTSPATSPAGTAADPPRDTTQ
ncbi:MAG TPA: glycosyltransferase [Gemmatimonadaceae bacterium]|nr:glycosyltransferase [Gemmatimonadaceae bacterium]